ncbi:MAG: hypothetical protein HQK49_01420 [Oligoflexia bacterium]|nr:hypothetical protein [Oligoflexia bacterium]
MRLKNAIEEKLYDSRLRDKFVADGRITKSQIDSYLTDLPDDQEKAHSIDLESPSTQNRIAKNMAAAQLAQEARFNQKDSPFAIPKDTSSYKKDFSSVDSDDQDNDQSDDEFADDYEIDDDSIDSNDDDIKEEGEEDFVKDTEIDTESDSDDDSKLDTENRLSEKDSDFIESENDIIENIENDIDNSEFDGGGIGSSENDDNEEKI